MDKKHIGNFLFIVFLFFGIFLISNFSKNLTPQIPENIKHVKIAGQDIKVDLALTPAQQEQGLSGTVALAENSGLLFVFEKSGQYSFWMKDMNFPIDMIWINENMKIVYIKKDATLSSFPETYGPSDNAKYVLEINSGFSDRNKLKEGDNVLFTYY